MSKKLILYHLSDLHVVDEQLRLWQLVRRDGIRSKRIAGWLNHHLNRRRDFLKHLRTGIIDYLKVNPWDYLVISGDLTTLALEREFRKARELLEPLIEKGPLILTPGNHDRYVRRSLHPDLMARVFHDCFPFNQASLPGDEVRYMELGDGAVIFEIATACPRLHISSRGKLQTDLDACEAFINRHYRERLKLAVGHYPAFLPAAEADG